MISLYYNGSIYIIEEEPFESYEESYTRAWFIVKNYSKYNLDELYSLSIINLNKDMEY